MSRIGRERAIKNRNAPRDLRGVPVSSLQALHLDQRHLRHRAAAGRWRAAALRPRRTRLARTSAALDAVLARLGQLLLLRRDRAFRILEAELLVAVLVLGDNDAHVSAGLEHAEQH